MALWHERNSDTMEMELQFGADHLKIAVDVSSCMSNSEVNNIQTSAALLYNVIIISGGIKRCCLTSVCLMSDVCLSHTSGLS